MNPLTPSKIATILTVLIALTLVCFPLSPQARAVCQDACLTNDNTVQGDDALINLTTGSENTANGSGALHENTQGGENTAVGFHALLNNTTGNKNIALGFRAGSDLTTGDHNIDIGNPGQPGESSTIRIGTQGTQTKTFIAGISDAAIGGMEVRVNQNGRLGIEP